MAKKKVTKKQTPTVVKKLTSRIEILEQRIDRIVAALDKSKSVRGL